MTAVVRYPFTPTKHRPLEYTEQMRMLWIVILIIMIFAGFQLVGLYRLKMSVSEYKQYWKNRAQQEGEIVYVALGDSAAQSVGASRAELGYVGLLTSHIEQATNKKVRVVNLSVSGAKVKDVLAEQLPQVKSYKPDIITVEIGGNNVASGFDAQTFKKEYTELAGVLPRGTIVSNIPYFGGRIRNNDQAIEASKIIETLASEHNLDFVDLQTPTKANQSYLNYASDLFHPSDRSYRLWEQEFFKLVEPKITKL